MVYSHAQNAVLTIHPRFSHICQEADVSLLQPLIKLFVRDHRKIIHHSTPLSVFLLSVACPTVVYASAPDRFLTKKPKKTGICKKSSLCRCHFYADAYLSDLKDQSLESFLALFLPQFSYLFSAEFFMLFLERPFVRCLKSYFGCCSVRYSGCCCSCSCCHFCLTWQIPPEMIFLTGETISAAGMVYDTPSSMAENCGFIQIPQSGCFFEIFVL